MRRLLALGLALGVTTLVTPGCGGGGGGGGGGPTQPPTPAQPRIEFTADGATVDGSIRLAGTSAGSGRRLILDVRAEAVFDLYGVSFELQFPQQVLDWVASSAAEGDHLSNNGKVDTELLIEDPGPGSLLVGLSRLGDVGGAKGSGRLLSLEFNVVGNGSGALVFADPAALNSAGDIRDDVAWIGGSVTASGQ